MTATPSADTAARTARRAEAGLLLMVVIWAVNFSVIKIGLAEIPPFAFNALRFPLAALVLAGVMLSGGRRLLPERRDIGRVIALGIVGNVLYQLFFISGMERSRAGNASVLLTGAPVYIALLSARMGHERVNRSVWLGIAATVVGMTLVVGSGEGGLAFGTDTIVGDLLLAACSVIWAFYTVGARTLIQRYGPVAITAWTLWIGAIGLLLVGLPDLLTMDASLSFGAASSVIYAGVLGIAVAYLLWYRAVRVVGNTRTATIGNLVPVLAILVAWVWLGEVPNVWQLVGAAVILAGVSLVRKESKVR